jgi:formamidopyrimidine-DNA glycosylase
MPELPEVHTTVTGLQQVLPGKSIQSVWTNTWSMSSLTKNTLKDRSYFPYFLDHACNSKIIQVRRRAKYIIIDLSNGYSIVIHMKMTGHLIYGTYKQQEDNPKDWPWKPVIKDSPLHDPYNRHIRTVFSLSNHKHLVFCDGRKFGTIIVTKTKDLGAKTFSHLGPEPLDESYTQETFKERLLKSKSRAIKTVLMDQSIVSGIGNIYSDEMLHRAHILPTRTPLSLNESEWKLLFEAMKQVLRKGIDMRGDSTSDYRNIDGARGAFHESHLVYLRTKKPCLRKNCSGIIKKQKLNGRSAHFCPVCQK